MIVNVNVDGYSSLNLASSALAPPPTRCETSPRDVCRRIVTSCDKSAQIVQECDNPARPCDTRGPVRACDDRRTISRVRRVTRRRSRSGPYTNQARLLRDGPRYQCARNRIAARQRTSLAFKSACPVNSAPPAARPILTVYSPLRTCQPRRCVDQSPSTR
jgi:hypothetical protein